MALTKALIIDRIYSNFGCSKIKATELTESIIETIKKSLESGEDVLISGFGKFCVKEKDERRGRNSATGNDMALEARRVVTFRCSFTVSFRKFVLRLRGLQFTHGMLLFALPLSSVLSAPVEWAGI